MEEHIGPLWPNVGGNVEILNVWVGEENMNPLCMGSRVDYWPSKKILKPELHQKGTSARALFAYVQYCNVDRIRRHYTLCRDQEGVLGGENRS